jgi:IPT/TIG domain
MYPRAFISDDAVTGLVNGIVKLAANRTGAWWRLFSAAPWGDRMRIRGRFSMRLVASTVSIVLVAAVPFSAQAKAATAASGTSATSITLVSGNAAVGATDPDVTVTDSCTGTPIQATVVAPFESSWAGPISGTQWDSISSSYVGCNEVFTTTFTLPAGAVAPTITVSDLADNSSNVSINGAQPFITGNVPGQCGGAFAQPAQSGSTTSGFVAGLNTLTFAVDNCYPAVGQNPTGIDFAAVVTYGAGGTANTSLGASYSGTAADTTDSTTGNLTLTGVSETPAGQVSGDATFANGLTGGGSFVGTVSGSSVDLTVASAAPSACTGGGCVQVVLSGTSASDGSLSGTYVVYTGSGPMSQGTWQVDPEPAPNSITTAVALDNPVAGANGVSYTVNLATGPNGPLTAASSTIAIAFAPGTSVAACSGISVSDLTAGTSGTVSSCSTSDGIVSFPVPIGAAAGDQLQVALSGAINAPVTGTQTAAISTSSNDAGSATYTLITGGTLTGTVQYETSSGLQPVTGSVVQACDGANCYSSPDQTPSDGSYTLTLPAGSWTVTAFAPTSNAYSVGQGSAGPADVTAGGSVSANVTLPALGPLPPGVTFNGQSGTVGVVYWSSPAALSVPGCTGGVGVAVVSSLSTITDLPVIDIGPMTESPAGSGTYTTTVPAQYPSHGTGNVSTQTECSPDTALLPSSGPASGGTEVQLTGSGFTGATAVEFGSSPAESFTVASDSQIDAVAPPGSGTVPVSVVTANGTITSTTLAAYTYLSVDSVSPANGPAAGGTNVTITGSGLGATEAVYFGSAAASDVDVISATEITATAPAGTGSVPVTVLTGDGGQSSTSTVLFDYTAASAPASTMAVGTQPAGTAAAGVTAEEGAELIPAEDAAGQFEAVNKWQEKLNTVGDIVHDMAESCESGTSAGPAFSNALNMAAQKAEADFGVAQAWLQASAGSIAGFGAAATFYAQFLLPLEVVGGAIEVAPLIAAGVLLYSLYELAESGVTVKDLTTDLDCAEKALPPAPDFTCNPSGFCYPTPTDFPIRIDPSGTVEDTNGNPVPGATVTLEYSDNPLGPFTAPASGSPIMVPSTNPELSDTGGSFAWDVFAGYYEVTASKAGCAAPGNPSQQSVSTPVLQVPPPQVGLVLTLSCPGESPPPKPVISGLSQGSGPTSGGTQVDVSGSGFTDTASVDFGGVESTGVTVLSPTEILATAPPGTGTVDVTVTTAGGTSAASAADQFTYLATPAVTAIAPASGPSAGGTTVQITGSGFEPDDQVLFGSAPASSVTVVSGTEITAIAPAGPPGTVDVEVTSPAGSSAQSPADQYTYLNAGQAPAITSPASTTLTAGTPGSFTVTTTGSPAPALTESGTLPSGVTFTDNGDGTATLAGTPAAGTGGKYPLTITAHNGITPDATQSFTLTVDEAPAITSQPAATLMGALGDSATVTTTGYPAPHLTETGPLPAGVTFTDNGDGTATIAATSSVASVTTFQITASNGVSPAATQSFTLTVTEPKGLSVLLRSSRTTTVSDEPVTLTAVTNKALQPGFAINIVDQTTGTVVASCTTGHRCQAVVANPAGTHAYQATIATPAGTITEASSAPLSVTWTPSTATLRASATSAVNGQPVLLSAHANENVAGTGYALDIIDTTTNTVVAVCAQGSSCSTWVRNPPGSHSYEAVIGTPAGLKAQASSAAVAVTWVPSTISLSVSTSSPKAGHGVTLTATANQNVGPTPWAIIITDLTTGQTVAFCGVGKKCSGQVSNPASRHNYQAVIANPDGSQVQATSPAVTVTWS